MTIEIHFVTVGSLIETASPVLPDGWVYVKPSAPYRYYDGIQTQFVQDRITPYGVNAGLIVFPTGVPSNTIVVTPNVGATNDPDDTFWEFFFDLSRGAQYRLYFRFDPTLRVDKHGAIEIGDIDPNDTILGTLVGTVADQAARLALPDVVGQRVYQTDTETGGQQNGTVFEQVASPASNPANWTDVTVLWSDVLIDPQVAGADPGSLQAHILAADPHPQYVLRSDAVATATTGTVADGLGYFVRLDPLTGRIDPSMIDGLAIAYNPAFAPSTLVSVTMQTAIDELDAKHEAHLADPTDVHPAGAITVTPSGNLTSVDAQAALVELQGDINGLNSSLAGKLDKNADDSTTGSISFRKATTYPVEFVHSGSHVLPFRSTPAGADEGYVGLFRGATDEMAMGIPYVPGFFGTGADVIVKSTGAEGAIVIRRDGQDSSILAVRNRFYAPVGVPIPDVVPPEDPYAGNAAAELTLYTLGGAGAASLRAGRHRIRGYVTIDKRAANGLAKVYIGANNVGAGIVTGSRFPQGSPTRNLVWSPTGVNDIISTFLNRSGGNDVATILAYELSFVAVGISSQVDVRIGTTRLSGSGDIIVRQHYYYHEISQDGAV